MHAVVTLLALIACADEAPDTTDGFTRDTSVRVLSPANGELVQSPFVLQFEAGADVSSVALTANGQEVAASTIRTASDLSDEPGIQGEVTVTLEDGRWTLDLVGRNAAGAEVSSYDLMVRVEDPEEAAWVSITSPADGAEVPNPVTFSVDASDGVDRVELYADDWLLGETTPGGTVTYEFSGTGFARTIDARAYAGDDMVATDTISVTVDPGTDPAESDWNAVVNALRASYPTDGTHGYYWPDDGDWYGTTQDIWYRGVRVAEGDPYGRCYCVGLTWEVFMRAFDEIDRSTGGDGTLNGMTVDALTEFRIDWFVRELRGAGPADALDNYGLGGRVTDRNDVRPGDFIQFWRHSGSGHNAVFVDWLTDGSGNIEGFRYWSTQSSTDGIDENEEYFGASGSTVDATYFFAARPAAPEDWIPYR